MYCIGILKIIKLIILKMLRLFYCVENHFEYLTSFYTQHREALHLFQKEKKRKKFKA